MLPTTKSAAPKNKTSQSEWSESEHDSPITKPHHQSTKSEPTHVISPAITKEEQAKTTQTRGAALFGANSEVLKTAMQLRRASLPEGNR